MPLFTRISCPMNPDRFAAGCAPPSILEMIESKQPEGPDPSLPPLNRPYRYAPNGQPIQRITSSALRACHESVGRLSPESGGILLGPVGESLITRVHFDATGSCSSSTYSPDHITLGRLLKDQWMPRGLDMKGFVHSHPSGVDQLSPGDLQYIRRLLEINPDMDVFAAPIMLPDAFRMIPFVVDRKRSDQGRIATLQILPD